MTRLYTVLWLVGSLLLSQGFAHGQGRNTEADLLKKELELLKRENDLLKRENELLKRENAELKKGGAAKTVDKTAEGETDSVTRVVVDNVEYVYQGSTRTGNTLIVTVLATSKDGNKTGPNGRMILVDSEGEKFTGQLVGRALTGVSLREGVPVKLAWQFGGMNAFTGAVLPGPSAKTTRFAGIMIQRTIVGGDDTIDFRNVPAVLTKSKTK